MIGLTSNTVSGSLPEPSAREIFSDPTRPMAGIAAPAGAAQPVDGGFRVSGRWAFGSGITHCDWAWAGCLVMDNGQPRMTPHGPDVVHVCMPVKDLQVHDTWHVSGLCGTGSNDFSASDQFVPADRAFLLLDTSRNRREPLYQMSPMLAFITNLACVSLGVARGALDEIATVAQTKTPTLHMVVLAETPAAQADIAKAEASLAAARAFLYEMGGEIWEAACAGRPVSERTHALARLAGIHAAETAAKVAQTANRLGGGSSIYTSSALQRYARDAEAVTHHFTVAPQTWEQAGRVLLGRKPTLPIF
jgi:alkylation response protein AidB-like acyl-CoA dehydrogenase